MNSTSKPCCDQESCIQQEIASLLQPGAPITDQICLAACVVAQTCSNPDREDLERCAAQLFDVPAECRLTKAFVAAYDAEREAMTERKTHEKAKTMSCR